MYEEKFVTPTGLKVVIREMTTRDEAMVAQAAEGKKRVPTKILKQLFGACIKLDVPDLTENEIKGGKEKGGKLNVDSLYSADLLFLLMALRCVTYGNDFTFQVRCPAADCNSAQEYTMDLLRDLEVRRLPEGILPSNATWTVGLPRTKKTLTWGLLTVADEEDVEKLGKEKKEQAVALAYYRRARSIGGVEKPADLDFFLDLPGMDSAALRRSIEDNEPGVRRVLDLECSDCGSIFKAALPLDESFFSVSVSQTA